MQKIFSSIMVFMTATIIYSQSPCPGVATVTYAGKTYNTVQIGTQCWLKENLDVGTMIQGSQNQTNNGIIEKYCYNNDPNNCAIYGGLYLWNEAMAFSTTAGAKGICPDGWHIPTKSETETLAATVNNNSNALKEIGQGMGPGAGTNTSGFTGLIAGYRDAVSPFPFYYLGTSTFYWSSTEYDATRTYARCLYYYDSKIYWDNYNKNWASSVRCLQDDNKTSVELEEELPKSFQLMQNYPNPFNPSTAISYRLSAFSKITLKVFDVLGKEVATLVDEYQQPGNFEKTFHGTTLSSGIYFYSLHVSATSLSSGNGFTESKKMLLIK